MKSVFLCLSFTLFSICVPAFGRPGPRAHKELDTLTIGCIFPLKGPQGIYGQEALAGISVGYSLLQQSDPQLAKRIRLEPVDDDATQAGMQKAIEHLVKHRVSLIIGSLSELSSQALVAQAHQHSIPVILPLTPNLSLPSPAFPLVVRSSYPDAWQGTLTAQFARQKLKKTRAALLIPTGHSGSRAIGEAFAEAFHKNGGKIVARESFHGPSNLAKQLKAFQRAQAEIILFPTFDARSAATVMKDLKRLKIPIPLLGIDRWDNPLLMREAGSAYAGHYFPLPFTIASKTPEALTFMDRFKQINKRQPSALAAMSYEAFIIAVEGFKRSSTQRPKDLHAALMRLDKVRSFWGHMRMNKEGFIEKPAVFLETTSAGTQPY